jgi:pantoate--beta-alanine ligase
MGMYLAADNAELEGWMWGRRGRVSFIPTMGALHEGHAELIRRGAELSRERGLEGCVVSIFVNPTQFNDKADLDRYPRTLEADLAICERAGAGCVYAPRVEDIYPPDATPPVPPLPRVAAEPGLEDAHRPGHFAGVCQVVLRLFRLVQPGIACFGEKDWQQLATIAAMTSEQGLGIEVVPVETVREPDGLAMSSRNRFLTPEDRARAISISAALRAALRGTTPDEAEGIMRRELRSVGIEPEYAVVRDAATLGRPVGDGMAGAWRALIAARVGAVRLIDNAAWQPAAVKKHTNPA